MSGRICEYCNEMISLDEPFCEFCENQKQEELSFQEACAAIGRGECVEDNQHRIFGNKGIYFSDRWHANIHHVGFFQPTGEPFKIVPDPSKQEEPEHFLTYAEALECEKVRIHWPQQAYAGRSFINQRFIGDNWPPYWIDKDLHAFDLAERRGYRMERVD